MQSANVVAVSTLHVHVPNGAHNVGRSNAENPVDEGLFVKIPMVKSSRAAAILYVLLALIILLAVVGLDYYYLVSAITHHNSTRENTDGVGFVRRKLPVIGASCRVVVAMLSTILAELFYRMCLLVDEIRNRKVRHDGQWSLAVSRTINFSYGRVLLLFIVTTIALLILVCCNWTSGQIILYLLINVFSVHVVIRLLCHAFRFQVLKKRGKFWSVGRVFALQYYHGYLSIVLPNLLERMKQFERDELRGTELAVRRLVLLAPESCYSPKTLDWLNANRNLVEMYGAKQIQPVIGNWCGTEGRIYKNPVYVIWHVNEAGQKKWSCFAVEGIAMLSNLHEMNKNELSTGMTRDRRREEYGNFCDALLEILSTTPYADLVELIRYTAEDDNDYLVSIADLIKQRFKEKQSS